jgi:hypothetical protein
MRTRSRRGLANSGLTYARGKADTRLGRVLVNPDCSATNDVCGLRRRDARLIFWRRPLPTEKTAHLRNSILLVGWRGGPEQASYAEKSEFTEQEHTVSGTAVKLRYVHEIVSGFSHEADDFSD